MKCSVRECKKECGKSGLCRNHMRAQKLYGDPRKRKYAPYGSGHINASGYVEKREGGRGSRKTLEHILVAEKAMGHRMPSGAVVHHVNEDRADNRPSNLVVCPDNAYHYMLHRRAEALSASGNPNYLKCQYCKKWDSPENIVTIDGSRQYSWYHKKCRKEYRQMLWRRNKCPQPS